jgi:hypothetical protein
MSQNSDSQITLFIRDEKTGRHAFNPKALKALGVDPVAARELGYPLKESEELDSNLAAQLAFDTSTVVRDVVTLS